mmetsp:Transcript_912/g.2311  ORF Transcript_912/g.2311 Transcript_912/m.2311 type:complete len:489 (+) Transcript_912:259-1725(+)
MNSSMLRRGVLQWGRRQSANSVTATATGASNLLHQRSPAAASSVLRAWFSSYPSHEVVGLPALSPTMETGTISSWNMGEGDKFGPGDVICSVETDKATVDFEAQDDGVVAKILVEAGSDELQVGTPILITVEEEEDAAAFASYVVEDSSSDAAPPAPAAEAPAPAAPEPVAAAAPAPAAAAPTGGRVVASPLAHMISKDMGYDISTIPGTGPDGRIIAADVREFVPSAAEAPEAATLATPAPAQEALAVAAPIPGAGFTDYPISETAREVASRLAQSKRNVPHYYLTVDVCMDNVLELRKELSGAVDNEEGLGVYEFIIKAAAKSMKAVPAANASWMDSAVRVYDSVDMNVVVGTGDDLYTPVIRDCGAKGLKAISDELNTAMAAVESGEVTSEFATMGTFTIMNLGMYGIKSCAPIVREPQSCALALGAMENRIVPNDDPDSDEIYKESVYMTATMSLDHRVVDGAAGAPWLSAFKSYLQSPSSLLL